MVEFGVEKFVSMTELPVRLKFLIFLLLLVWNRTQLSYLDAEKDANGDICVTVGKARVWDCCTTLWWYKQRQAYIWHCVWGYLYLSVEQVSVDFRLLVCLTNLHVWKWLFKKSFRLN
jgi:hypothetical protein